MSQIYILVIAPILASAGVFFFAGREAAVVPIVWSLGYLHVLVSFAHAFRKENLKIHGRFFLFLGVLIVGLGSVSFWYNPIILNTMYFLFFSLVHYPRQTYGILKLNGPAPSALDQLVLFIPAAVGITTRFQGHSEPLLGMKVYIPSLPPIIYDIANILGWALLLLWAIKKILQIAKTKKLSSSELILISHVTVMTVAFLATQNFLMSFAIASIYHYVQYLVFSHHYLKFYVFFLSIALTVVFYAPVWVSQMTKSTSFAYSVYGYVMILNFLHYLVDTTIWKSRHGYLRPRSTV